ncbi:hypothetical protein D3C80_2156450 [compost metagenome]
MIDKRHQHGFGHFAQVAAEGAEQLAFRQHGTGLGLALEKPILGPSRRLRT